MNHHRLRLLMIPILSGVSVKIDIGRQTSVPVRSRAGDASAQQPC